MTKKPATTKRPSPPDRDGDGQPGGSLPGNQTVETAKGPDPLAGADDATRSAVEDQVRPGSEEQASAEGGGGEPWTREDDMILLKLAEAGFEINAEVEGAVTLEQVKGWTDARARAVEDFADEYVDGALNDDGDMLRADGTVIDLPAELGRNVMAEIDDVEASDAPPPPPAENRWTRDDDAILEDLQLVDEGFATEHLTLADVAGWSDDQAREAQTWADAMQRRPEDDEIGPPPPEFLKPHLAGSKDPDAAAPTFTADEVAAGKTPVVEAEGEAVTTAAEVDTVIPDEDPLVTIDTAAAPVAVRLGNLQRLVDNRWLYRTAEGYSPNYHAPYVGQDEVDAWIRAGFARYDATAGSGGGVRVETEARTALRRQLQLQEAG